MSLEAQAVCYAIAFVCFILAALSQASARPVAPRVHFVALGLAAWVLVALVVTLDAR